jgi:hypothetical protein
MRVTCYVFFQHLNQATLANATFATQQYHLPLAILDLVPAFQEQSDFLFSSYQWCQTSGGSNI